jgi:hypothetical protein
METLLKFNRPEFNIIMPFLFYQVNVKRIKLPGGFPGRNPDIFL